MGITGSCSEQEAHQLFAREVPRGPLWSAPEDPVVVADSIKIGCWGVIKVTNYFKGEALRSAGRHLKASKSVLLY